MARKARCEVAAGVSHVYARGNNGETIFRDDVDREDYLLRLRLVADELGWRCLSYCLMGNHLHLIIKTTKPNLAAGMRIVQGGYARQFNRRHGRTGHLFGDRYGSVTIKGDDHFRVAARYVARNPFEAGLAKKLGEWPWESNADRPTVIARRVVDRPELLRLFGLEGDDPDERERRYRSFVTQPLPP